ncbi:MAG: tRNA (5-methylaminomethyl-2-thiouridylate)-methyltransferase [Sphingobacteriales bacterium]|nr:MAG: tRNA (5-methylaminomethyl-2-thiouridylate)-methyltransferase [Sphingobacteriales bacterium]
MQNLEIVTTADGSKTIFNPSVGENYHSKHGALQESLHVFVGKGLQYYLENNPNAKSVSVLEVGFGTGLNFLLSAQHCIKHNIKLDYTGIEAFPLSNLLISQTEYKQYIEANLWETFLTQYQNSITETTSLNAFCNLTIAHTNLLDFKSEKLVDIIYFDAFAAIHQPQMWTLESISHTVKFLKPGGVFVTYAITGNLKRMLTTLGMQIEKVPGAANKREMLRAIKVG